MIPTKCMKESCVHLVIGGKGITHYYMCELDHNYYCGEPEFDINEDIWKDMEV